MPASESEPTGEQLPNEVWDSKAWKGIGRKELQRRHEAKSATQRDVLIILLRNLDEDLKLALLSSLESSLELTDDDTAKVSEADPIAAAWLARIEQERQVQIEAYEAKDKLVPELIDTIIESVEAHPSIRREHQEDLDSEVLIGEFKGVYNGEEIQYRVVLPASPQGKTSPYACLELPQVPEAFEPDLVDFGQSPLTSKSLYPFAHWRERVSGPIALVGSIVKLSGASAFGSLVFDKPDAPPISYFGNIPSMADNPSTQLPAAYDDALDFSRSEAGQTTLANPSLAQLKELQELIANSRPIEVWESAEWRRRRKVLLSAREIYDQVKSSLLDDADPHHPANMNSDTRGEWDRDWDKDPEWLKMNFDSLREEAARIEDIKGLDEDKKLWHRAAIGLKLVRLHFQLARAAEGCTDENLRSSLAELSQEAKQLGEGAQQGAPEFGSEEWKAWVDKHNPPLLENIPPYDVSDDIDP